MPPPTFIENGTDPENYDEGCPESMVEGLNSKPDSRRLLANCLPEQLDKAPAFSFYLVVVVRLSELRTWLIHRRSAQGDEIQYGSLLAKELSLDPILETVLGTRIREQGNRGKF